MGSEWGLVLQPYDIDMTGADSFSIQGLATAGFGTGLLEPQINIHIMPKGVIGGDVGIICIDSAYIPPSGSLVFQDYTHAFAPVVTWAEGGLCFPVAVLANCGVQFTGFNPGPHEVDHCVNTSVNFVITVSECANGISSYVGRNTGQGQATVNGGVLTYIPAPEDAGSIVEVDLVVEVQCPPSSSIGTVQFAVSGGAEPELTAGIWHREIGINNIVIKDDIIATDNDLCAEITFSKISGPGNIDAGTGVFSWNPTSDDIGEHWIFVEVSDGAHIATDSMYLQVIADSDMYGNVNCNDGVNIGDAVSLIGYIFKDRACPPIKNWADTNGDCEINIGDVVRIVNYVFNGGDPPVAGCVN